MWARRPSGIKTVPKFFPWAALYTTTSAILLTMSGRVSPLYEDSSEMIVRFGWVLSAHSMAKWEGSFPINLIKYQYLEAEALSVSMFPINWEYTFEAVSNPSEV